MMNFTKIAAVLLVLCGFSVGSRAQAPKVFANDSVIVVPKAPRKGFANDYILFIPKGLKTQKQLYLLVEPNNTGKVSDSMEVHKAYALDLAASRSVGNNVSTELRIPLLVPIFPRPESKSLTYTHALDRDVMLESSADLKRLDLQLIAMVKDAQNRLKALGIPVYDPIFLNGFSASGTFANRFVMLHPEMVKAAAMGGINGELMLPIRSYAGREFDYPLGTNDLRKISGSDFDAEAYKKVPQFVYMGALDDNDAVQYDDAYDERERRLINGTLGQSVPSRWARVQQIYKDEKVNARFATYPEVGHWTTAAVNLDVILFFNDFLKQKQP